MNETQSAAQTAAVTKIQARIAAVEVEREAFIAASQQQVDAFLEQTNRQVAFFNGKVAALRELIAPPAPAEPPPDA